MIWEDRWDEKKASYKIKTKLTWNDFIDGLPQELPEPLDLNAIGGLTRNGWTDKDIDFYMDNPNENEVKIYRNALKTMTLEIFNKPSDLGNTIFMLEPRPIPILLYVNGILKDREELKALVTEQPTKALLKPKDIIDIEARLTALETN